MPKLYILGLMTREEGERRRESWWMRCPMLLAAAIPLLAYLVWALLEAGEK